MRLTDAEISSRLQFLPDWRVESGVLSRTFAFEDFLSSLTFVNRVGELAERVGHHPDIDIRYNKVKLALISHDLGGLTERDFQLAAALDQIPTKN